jgi:hypothetical protein
LGSALSLAAGRQAEVYNFVAEEVVRQQASGYGFAVDLDTGTITVIARSHAIADRREEIT